MVNLTEEDKNLIQTYKSLLQKNDIVSFLDKANRYDNRSGHIGAFMLEKGIDIFSNIDRIPSKFLFEFQLDKVTIPDHIQSIGDLAFGNSELKEVVIGNGVKVIGKHAFSGCEKLTSVTLGESVSKIGERAFSGCPNLKEIYLPDSVSQLGYKIFENNNDVRIYAHSRKNGLSRLRCKQEETEWYKNHLYSIDE